MPLSNPVARKELHCRTIEMRGYAREDGLIDMEGRITDVRTTTMQARGGREVPKNTPWHEMWVRLTIGKDLVIREVECVTDFSPFPECPGAAPGLQKLKGVSMGKGWRKAISEKLGGTLGCTHIRELLNTLGSATHQTMGSVRTRNDAEESKATKIPAIVDTCHAYSSDSPLVVRRWPALFGAKASPDGKAG